MERRPLTTEEKRALQLSEIEILDEFRRICDKAGLRYFLTAGTLLGAVRHKGFIPWDDDIDVSMPRSDYDRFCQICSAELGKDYVFQNSWTVSNFPYFFSKLRKNGTEVYEECLAEVDIEKGHYIDIFPLDVCPESNWGGLLYFKIMGLFNSVYNGKINSAFVCGYSKSYMKFLFRLLSRFSVERIRSFREKFSALPARLCKGRRLCIVGGVHGYPAETSLACWFGEAELMFEGKSYSVPACWHEFLENLYGDYNKLPDEDERTGHFLT